MIINYTRTIKAPAATVWSVITDMDQYPKWNPLMLQCSSTLNVGDPIRMVVQLTPDKTIKQKETIKQHKAGELLEYGVSIPLLLNSYRQHELIEVDENTTEYHSRFRLAGLLSPLVRFLLGKHLRQGFLNMTDALVKRAESLN